MTTTDGFDGLPVPTPGWQEPGVDIESTQRRRGQRAAVQGAMESRQGPRGTGGGAGPNRQLARVTPGIWGQVQILATRGLKLRALGIEFVPVPKFPRHRDLDRSGGPVRQSVHGRGRSGSAARRVSGLGPARWAADRDRGRASGGGLSRATARADRRPAVARPGELRASVRVHLWLERCWFHDQDWPSSRGAWLDGWREDPGALLLRLRVR